MRLQYDYYNMRENVEKYYCGSLEMRISKATGIRYGLTGVTTPFCPGVVTTVNKYQKTKQNITTFSSTSQIHNNMGLKN